jgi:hypothetical protein
MSNGRGTVRFWRSGVAVLAVAVFSGACTSDGAGGGGDRTSEDRLEELFRRDPDAPWPLFAGLGSDLAFIRLGESEPADENSRVGYRPIGASSVDVDGEWSDLPVPEVFGDYGLASAGETIVLGGLECVSETCTAFRPRFLVLSADRSRWIDSEVDLPVIELPFESESEEAVVHAYQRPMGHAVFSIGFTGYAVAPDAEVVELTRPEAEQPGVTQFHCRTDDLEILVRGEVTPDGEHARLTGMVSIRRIDQLEAGYVEVAPVLDVTVETPYSDICGFRQFTLEAGSTSYTFDVDANSWTEAISNRRDFTGGSPMAEAPVNQVGIVDGTVFEGTRRRDPDGTWSFDFAEGRTLVFTNGPTIYAIQDGAVSVYRP